MVKRNINIIEYDDESQEIKVKYLGSIPYYKIRDIDTTEGNKDGTTSQETDN
jgi:hypothetical protein